MDAELSVEEFDRRLARRLEAQREALDRQESENQQLRVLLNEKKQLADRLRTFLHEIEAESARIDAAIARVTTSH